MARSFGRSTGGGFKSPGAGFRSGAPKAFKASSSGGAPKAGTKQPLQPGIAPHKIPRIK